MNLLTVLPLTFVMVAGPQILSAIFLATSADWRRNSAAYVFGAALSITLVVTIAYVIGGGGGSGRDDPSDGIYIAIVVLLLAAMVHTYLKRAESEPPKWMGKLQDAKPRFSFTLGFLLLGIFPTDILTSVAVGSFLANKGDPLWHCLVFVALTLLLLSLPAIALLAFGERGQAFLPKARDWMNDNSWLVNEVVLALFVVITAGNLV